MHVATLRMTTSYFLQLHFFVYFQVFISCGGQIIKVGRFHPFYRSRRLLRVSRGIALLFLGTRHLVWGSASRPGRFYPGKDPIPIVQEAGWAPGPVWTGGKSRPCRDSIPDRPARSQSLYRLSYSKPQHKYI